MSNQTPTALEQFFQFLIKSNGTALAKRPIINFLGGTVVDDPANNQILVTLSGGGGGSTNLTANFTQPAVDATAVAQVTSSGGLAPGVDLFVLGGGYYQVTAVPDGTHVTLQNLGSVDNAAPGATVTAGGAVIPSGPRNTLIQANGAPITQRGTLDLLGFTYVDDAGGNRMQLTANPTMAGDVTGTAAVSKVVAIQNVALASTAPTDQQVLTYLTSSGKWTPQTPPVGFVAGGDLSGTATSQEVIGILNKALPSLPGSDQYLHYSGSAWAFSALPSSLPPSGSAGGDLSGTYPNPSVAKANGASVPAAGSLTIGNVLQVSAAAALIYAAVNLAGGANYVTGVLPTANQASQTMGGDVSGTTAAATVAAIQGNTVTSGALTKGQFFIASSTSNWAATTLSGDVTASSVTPGLMTLASTGVTATTYGDGTHVGQFTVDAKGRLTAASSVAITGAAPTGSAGGDLSGTYPNPSVAAISGTSPIAITPATLQWTSGTSSPTLTQASISSASGQDLTVQAQGATGGSHNGGNLVLAGGTSGSATAGAVRLQTAGATRLTISAAGLLTAALLNAAGLVHTNSSGDLSTSTLVDADVSASAAIAVSKLAAGTAGQVLLNNATPTPTWTSLSGDVTISATGATTVAAISGSSPIAITPNEFRWVTGATPLLDQTSTSTTSGAAFTIQAQGATGASHNGGNLVLAGGTSGSATAGIVQLQTAGSTRLTVGAGGVVTVANLGTGVVHADSSGNLTSSTLVDADVSASAAIAVSKLAAGTSAQVLLSNATPTATWTTLSSDVTISATGATTVNSISGASPLPITPNILQWVLGATAPQLNQATTSVANGATLTIQAQNATGASHNGGQLTLAAGSSGSATAGSIVMQTATTTRLTITAAGVVTIAGISTGLVHADGSGNLTSSTLVNADVAAAAAIAVSKLAAGTSAQVLLNNGTPTPTWTSISGDVALTNAGVTSISSLAVSKLAAGTAAQVLLNNGTPTPTWTTLSGDVTVGSTGTTTVGAISGTSPISITPNTLQWIQGATGPTLSQAQQANGSAPVNFTIAPQAPGSGASSTSTGTPASFVVNVALPVSTGAEAGIVLQRNGAVMVALYGGSHGSIWFDGTTSSTGNKISGAGPQLAYNASTSGHTWSVDGVGGGLMALASALTLAVKININTTKTATAAGDIGMDLAGSTASGRPQAWVDGVAHGLSAWRGYFGDGSDGSATCDGSTTVAGMSAPSGNSYTLTRDCYFTSLTINSGVTVNAGAYRLFVRDTLTHNGTGILSNGAPGAVTGGGGAISTFTLGGSTSGGSGGASPSVGGNTLKSYGGSGGAGGNTGAAGGTATAPTSTQGSIRQVPEAVMGAVLAQNANGNPTFFTVMGGAGGGGGTGTNGGGGGSGGGVIGIYARILTGNGPINAKGGAGANAGATSGGGGGGGGGAIILVVGDKSSWTGTTSVAGGAAGTSTSGGAAVAGSAGTVITILA